MNAPFRQSRIAPDAATTLHLFAFFHLNLAFSSIEEEQRGEVIERCYWPLLELAQECGPIGIEAYRLHAGGNRRARSRMDRPRARADRQGPHRAHRLAAMPR